MTVEKILEAWDILEEEDAEDIARYYESYKSEGSYASLNYLKSALSDLGIKADEFLDWSKEVDWTVEDEVPWRQRDYLRY